MISYSSRSKKRGEFDADGLTVTTRPDPVKLGRAVWNEDRTEVTLTWNKSGGATAYLVYRRTDDEPKWTRLTALAADAVKYVDPSPDPDGKNIYTVLSYNLDAKVSGQYDKTGVQPVTQQEAQTADLAKTLQATATASKTGQIILVVDHNLSFWEKSSAIFLHCKSYDHWSTAGCVSVEEHVMKELLQMSHNGAYIIIVKDQEDISKY